MDGEVGAAGSTGRGEANLYNLSSFFIVEALRRGAHPKDAGLEALKRVVANTVEKRLLNERGKPAFDLQFYILNKRGEHAGLRGGARTRDRRRCRPKRCSRARRRTESRPQIWTAIHLLEPQIPVSRDLRPRQSGIAPGTILA